MQSERRDLEYTFKGLTDEQVVEKKRMLRESAEAHPEIAEYFRELAVDFCVRFPEEATRQQGGRCGRGVARVGAREECHAAEARP